MTSNVTARTISRIAAAAALGLGLTVAVAGCSTAPGQTEPVGATAPATTAPTSAAEKDDDCGGQTINHAAAITSAHDLLIEAPLDHVWDVQTDVENWDSWQDAVQSIDRLDTGALASGSQFRWTTPVPESQLSPADTLAIDSTVMQVDPEACIIWEGPAVGAAVQIEQGVHLWTFTAVDGGTLVHTEESWDAELLASLEGADADAAETMLGGGLVVWLENLKAEAESTL